MRIVHDLQETGERIILEDANGFVVQQVPTQDFLMYDHETDEEYPFHREGGWWDMRMEYRVNPARIAFPARVVWERVEVAV